MTKLYGYVSNMGAPEYDDIMQSDLPTEEKVKQIQMRGQAYRDELDRDAWKNYARMGLGTLISGASMHPILNIPYIGTGLGGAMYELGQGMVEGDKLPDIAKRTGQGFLVGETVGALPYAGKGVNKLSGGKIGEGLGNVASKIAETPTWQKVEDALMTDIKAFNPYKQTAYHGSPYDFEKFSNEAIGTGEGAQAHGIGHYAAKNKDVASDYADRLTKAKEGESSTITYDNTPYEFKYGNDILENPEKPFLASVYANRGNYKDVVNQYLNQYNDALRQLDDPAHIEWLRAIGDKSDTEATRAGLQRARDFVNNFDINKLEQKTNKQLYKLSVPKDDVMLREDLPFSEQPKAVQDAIQKIANKTKPDIWDINKTVPLYNLGNLENQTGKDIYKSLISELGKKDFKIGAVKTAGLLNKNGIKGISYNGGIDGEARVIFNPDDIDIVRKYYNQKSLADMLLGRTNYGGLGAAIAD